MDAVFGSGGFRNEIVWRRSGGKSDARRWGRTTDRILYYAKSDKFTWNRQYQPLDPDYVSKTYRYDDDDGRGAYTTMPLHAAGLSGGESGRAWRGYSPGENGNHWRTPTKGVMNEFIIENGLIPGWPLPGSSVHERLEALDKAGLIAWSSRGVPRIKTYLSATKGKAASDLLTDIPMASGNERTGYATQKTARAVRAHHLGVIQPGRRRLGHIRRLRHDRHSRRASRTALDSLRHGVSLLDDAQAPLSSKQHRPKRPGRHARDG